MPSTATARALHSFIWKIASRCNINCTYCYVYNLADARWRGQPAYMSREVARQTSLRIREHCEVHNKRDASIVFHGGEPLMGGAALLDELGSTIAETFAGSSIEVKIGIQSNGLLFTPEIGELMLRRRMSIGVSLDGPPNVNDAHRVDKKGQGTSAELERRLALLLSPRYRPLFRGFLCVIDVHADPVSVVDYLLSYCPPSIDFLLPLDNHDRLPVGKTSDRNATPYGDWLISCFDHWISCSTSARVRFFDAIIKGFVGAPTGVESVGVDPVDLIVVESNGEIEGVDCLKASFDGATRLGYDVFRHSFETVCGDMAVLARQMGVDALSQECRDCSLVRVCGGGYLPHRYSSERGFDNPSIYCADLTKLIRHVGATVLAELRGAGIALAEEARGDLTSLSRPGR
jgi:uncharacterized protein